MKKLLILSVTLFVAILSSAGEQTDSLTHAIFKDMPGNVRISQPEDVRIGFFNFMNNGHQKFLSDIKKGGSRNKAVKFRIRIFSDSTFKAANSSAAALARFKAAFPDIPANRTFESPFFKVTVGKFSNRPEAEKALTRIRARFPSAYIVRN